MRIDQLLVKREFYKTRSQASSAIKEKRVKINGIIINKAGFDVAEDCNIEVNYPEERFVSRGGYKLLTAIREFNIDLKNKTVLDIGASTGGFTDCALQHGAEKVYAYDVGSQQLDEKIRNDKRVVVKENINCRYLKKEDFADEIDFICMDVSFISCTKMFEAISSILDTDKEAVILFKPQFEVGNDFLNKKGIVTDNNEVLKKLNDCKMEAEKLKLIMEGYVASDIKGTDGNQEYLLYFIKK